MLKRLPLSCRDYYRSVESITRHMYSDLRVSGSRGGEPKGKGVKKGEREEEKRKNQDLGWRKMAVPMQTTRRAPRTSSGHWTGK